MRATVGWFDREADAPRVLNEGPSDPPPRSGDGERQFGVADFERPGPIAREFTLVWGGGESPQLAPAGGSGVHDNVEDSDGFCMVSVHHE